MAAADDVRGVPDRGDMETVSERQEVSAAADPSSRGQRMAQEGNLVTASYRLSMPPSLPDISDPTLIAQGTVHFSVRGLNDDRPTMMFYVYIGINLIPPSNIPFHCTSAFVIFTLKSMSSSEKVGSGGVLGELEAAVRAVHVGGEARCRSVQPL